MNDHPSVVVLGAGSMGEAFARGLLASGWPKDRVVLVARRESRAQDATRVTGLPCLLDPVEALRDRDIAVVSVKPKDVDALLEPLTEAALPMKLMISFVAGVPTMVYEKGLLGTPVVRAMPNIGSTVRDSITPYAPGTLCTGTGVQLAEQVLGTLGPVIRLDEHLLDAVTAVSGTGPAYAFLLAEALTDAAIREGLPRDVAERLVHHTIRGAGRLLVDTTDGPHELRAKVTSPGGTTAAAMHVLEGGFRALLEDAVRAAAARSREMGGKASDASGS